MNISATFYSSKRDKTSLFSLAKPMKQYHWMPYASARFQHRLNSITKLNSCFRVLFDVQCKPLWSKNGKRPSTRLPRWILDSIYAKQMSRIGLKGRADWEIMAYSVITFSTLDKHRLGKSWLFTHSSFVVFVSRAACLKIQTKKIMSYLRIITHSQVHCLAK